MQDCQGERKSLRTKKKIEKATVIYALRVEIPSQLPTSERDTVCKPQLQNVGPP